MIFSNSNIRRQDRLLDEASAVDLLKTGEYGVLSLYSVDSGVYGLPINYVWDGDRSIFLHCALQGKKIDILKKNNRVSFCIVGKTNVLSDKFTTEYESVILECIPQVGLSDDLKMSALSLIIDKYSPSDVQEGMKYAKISFSRTEIIRLTIIKWSGKCKRVR